MEPTLCFPTKKEIFSFSYSKSCTRYATWPSFQGADCICINNNSLMFIKSLILHESIQLYRKASFMLRKIQVQVLLKKEVIA